MESQEEFMGSNDHTQIVKGKRTKRQRPSSPFGLAVTSSSSSGYGGSGGVGGGGGGGGGDYGSISSAATTSGEIYEGTEEEEDMANCLILLAQGDAPRQHERFHSRKLSEMAATTSTTTGSGSGKTAAAAAGFYVYECKTCNRTFPSFQALGGHRASHKKPKAAAMVGEKKEKEREKEKAAAASSSMDYLEEGQILNNKSFPAAQKVAPQIANKGVHINKTKIHECSICGLEFMSGQALGGHMRRHRAASATGGQVVMSIETTSSNNHMENVNSQHVEIKPRNILSLDLNLPAPPEDDSKFQFTTAQQSLVFSTPALVDCHY